MFSGCSEVDNWLLDETIGRLSISLGNPEYLFDSLRYRYYTRLFISHQDSIFIVIYDGIYIKILLQTKYA